MTAAHTLATEGLTLGYGDRTIVPHLDLQVPAGRITAIVGANGCGKSTLLKALARLITPTAGQVILDGKALHTRSSKEIARKPGRFTSGLIDAVRLVGPSTPITKRGLSGVDASAASQASRASRAPDAFNSYARCSRP